MIFILFWCTWLSTMVNRWGLLLNALAISLKHICQARSIHCSTCDVIRFSPLSNVAYLNYSSPRILVLLLNVHCFWKIIFILTTLIGSISIMVYLDRQYSQSVLFVQIKIQIKNQLIKTSVEHCCLLLLVQIFPLYDHVQSSYSINHGNVQ